MRNTMKLINLIKYLFVVLFSCTFYTVIVTKNVGIFQINSGKSVLKLLFSWIPVIVMFIISAIYCVYMCSKELKKIRKYIYVNILLVLIDISTIFLPLNVDTKFEKITYTVLLLLILLLLLYFNFKIECYLIFKNFSVDEELEIMSKVKGYIDGRNNHKYSLMYNRLLYLYCLPFIISANSICYCLLVSAVLVVLNYNFVMQWMNNVDKYDKNLIKKYITAGITASALIMAASILFYCNFENKYFSFILIFATSLPKYILDNKFSIRIREEFENNNIGV